MERIFPDMQTCLFDSHCHLDDARFDEDREQLIASLPGHGIGACLTCGSDLPSSRAALELAKQYDFIYAAAGIHPHEAGKAAREDLAGVGALLTHPRVVALGEIGLDFYYDFSPRETQEALLIEQLDLAFEMKKPVILHVRESHGAMLDILRARKGRLPGGVLHCFSGSAQSVPVYEKLGFHISFAGSVTFKNAAKLREAARAVSPDRLLIETDSPYLSPEPFRGRRNHPGQVAEVCRALADAHRMSFEEMAELTCRNAAKLFGTPQLGGTV